jgi:hypothetical protein
MSRSFKKAVIIFAIVEAVVIAVIIVGVSMR